MFGINLISIGILLLIVGIILVFIGILLQAKEKARIEGGGVVFIGPFPIIGATSERALYFVIALSTIFLLMIIILNLIGR